MSARSGLPVELLIELFEGKLMLRDPRCWSADRPEEGWLTREQYVRGNIFRLLEEAEEANRESGLFLRLLA